MHLADAFIIYENNYNIIKHPTQILITRREK